MSALRHRAWLRLLGCDIVVRCRSEKVRDGITGYFSAPRPRYLRTPDIIVDCELAELDRYLFRSRPASDSGPLPGVRVYCSDSPASGAWLHLDPPLPPFRLQPLGGRFVGLHAGAARLPGGGAVVVVGHRGAGKTTTMVELVNNHGCALLTDETVYLHRRTKIVEPMHLPIGVVSTVPGEKHAFPAAQACRELEREPTAVRAVVILAPGVNRTKTALELLPESSAIRELLPHHVDLGATPDESMVTLWDLVHEVPTGRLSYGSFDDLRQSADLVLAFGAALDVH